jgi:hypothetical protein
MRPRVVVANGGKVLGAVRAPLNTSDFASYVLQAKQSGAQVLGFANAGHDFANALKAASEFGVLKTMRPAALLVFDTDINAIGLETTQGLYLTTAWYWDLNDKTRAFAKRFMDKMGREPNMGHAGFYSATLTYLNAVKAVGSTDADKVMDQLRKVKINDMFTDDGTIRADGLDGTFHVRDAGQEAVGIEISLGLLSRGAENVGRRGIRETVGFDLPTGQEIELPSTARVGRNIEAVPLQAKTISADISLYL